MFEGVFPYHWRNNTYDYHLLLIEGPKDVASGEILRLSCRGSQLLEYKYLLFPMSWSTLLDKLSNRDDIVDYFHKYLFTRPQQLAAGGRYNLIKLSETKFMKSQHLMQDKDRYVFSTSTSTSTGDQNFSEIVICWESSVYELVKTVRTGSFWKLASVSATFFLAAERLWHLQKRLVSQ